MVFEPDSINVGIITAVEDGLLIPVIRGADQLSLKDVVFEARAAIERALAGNAKPPWLREYPYPIPESFGIPEERVRVFEVLP
jgi:pyruvate/2-oxoglutarate dehydrogenase complex dihydrolipoamide acyltransferase (E2) component